MDLITRRKIQERLKVFRRAYLGIRNGWMTGRTLISTALRQVPPVRTALHLPSVRSLSWKDWLVEHPDLGEECSLDHEIKVTRKLPHTNEPEVHWYFRKYREVAIERTFVASIRGGRAWGHYGGSYYSPQGEHLHDLGKEHWMNYGNSYQRTRLAFLKPKRLAGTAAVLAYPDSYANFSHWQFDVLPRFGLLERAGLTSSKIDHYLVGHTAKPFQHETFARAGIPPGKIIPFNPKDHYEADTLVVPFLSAYANTAHQPDTLDYVRRLSGLPARPAAGDRLLFVSRRDASVRRLLQEDVLESELKKLGFEWVVLAGKNLEETAAIFARARVVVGPFGSGLMNIVYCPRGAKVVEILQPSFFNCHHWYLSDECGLEHHYYMGLGEPVPPGGLLVDYTRNIEVNASDLVRYVRSLL